MEDKDQEQLEVGEREAMQKWMGWGQRLGEKVENNSMKGLEGKKGPKGPEGRDLGRETMGRVEVGQGVPGVWPRPSMAVVRSHMARLPLAWPVSR